MSNKTWSREVAVVLLGFLGYLAVVGNISALGVLTLPFVGFATVAFGLKQESVKTFMGKKSE